MSHIEVPLTKNQVAFVSPEDYTYIAQWRWRYSASTGYAVRYINEPSSKGTVWMHREIFAHILGYPIPRGYMIDHRDNNRLNQQRSNLRLASPSENA